VKYVCRAHKIYTCTTKKEIHIITYIIMASVFIIQIDAGDISGASQAIGHTLYRAMIYQYRISSYHESS
jgi:hypothetical protein